MFGTVECVWARSRVSARTATEGMLSPLAHDLEISVPIASGHGSDDDAGWSASLRASVSALQVTGALRRGAVDATVLSSRDRAEIERRLREEVLAGAREIEVEARGERDRGSVTVRLGARHADSALSITRMHRDGDEIHVEGSFALSLRALGIGPVRGPLGMFRVADRVEIQFATVFVRTQPPRDAG